jgi:hypothetical protein
MCSRTRFSIPRTGPPGKITDQELIALAVAQAATGLCSDRQFVGVTGWLLPGWFPRLPEQSQYNRRLRRLTPYITTVQLMVAEGRIRPRRRDPDRVRQLRRLRVQKPHGGHRRVRVCARRQQVAGRWVAACVAVLDCAPALLIPPRRSEERFD